MGTEELNYCGENAEVNSTIILKIFFWYAKLFRNFFLNEYFDCASVKDRVGQISNSILGEENLVIRIIM